MQTALIPLRRMPEHRGKEQIVVDKHPTLSTQCRTPLQRLTGQAHPASAGLYCPAFQGSAAPPAASSWATSIGTTLLSLSTTMQPLAATESRAYPAPGQHLAFATSQRNRRPRHGKRNSSSVQLPLEQRSHFPV